MPRVERGEQLNVGVVVYCRQREFLDLRAELDEPRLAALAPDLDLADVRASLEALRAIVCGEPAGGALAELPPSERFGWLVAPASTIIQPSEVHTGLTDDPRGDARSPVRHARRARGPLNSVQAYVTHKEHGR